MYENYPFWFTLLTSLGFKVMISGRSSSHELFETGIESIASENICYPAKLVHGHIKWLLNKGIKTIFYPCVSYEDNLVPNTDNHYNCPVVANYPLVVGANMPELRDPDVRYMHPYFNLANHELMVDRIVEEFAWANVTREEAETAVKAAYAEDKVFKHDVQQEGLTALAYMKEHNCRGIVLAGRPYHIDPEINHGIPETICALGMVVLSEDSICELQPGEKLNLTDFLSEGEEDPRSKNVERIPPRRRPHSHRQPHAVARHQPVGLPLPSVRGRALRRLLSGPRTRAAQLLRLRSRRHHHRSGGRDPRRQGRRVHAAQDRRGLQPGRGEDSPALAQGRRRGTRGEQGPRGRRGQGSPGHVARPCNAPKSTGFRKTGSNAPTPGRQILLDSTMAANPKLTKAMRDASKRAAEARPRRSASRKNGVSDGTTA